MKDPLASGVETVVCSREAAVDHHVVDQEKNRTDQGRGKEHPCSARDLTDVVCLRFSVGRHALLLRRHPDIPRA